MKKTIKVSLDINYQGEFCGDRDNQCEQLAARRKNRQNGKITGYSCRIFHKDIAIAANCAYLRCDKCLDYCEGEVKS